MMWPDDPQFCSKTHLGVPVWLIFLCSRLVYGDPSASTATTPSLISPEHYLNSAGLERRIAWYMLLPQ